MNRGKVLLAAPVHAVLKEGLLAQGFELLEFPQINQELAMAQVPSCVGIITSTRIQVNQIMIDAAPNLSWVGRMGSGMEVIDVEYARSRGIHCFFSPEGNANAVAEHAMGLLLSLTKHIADSAAEVILGQWRREENRGMELEGKTIGIIGLGHTGKAFAKLLSGFGCKILAYDTQKIENIPANVSFCHSLDRIWAEASVLSFHVPMAADTYHYFNADFLAKMQQPFILLNTSRGTVVDATILPDALKSAAIIGLGLDVWEQEPIKSMPPASQELMLQLAKNRRVIITPHIAGYTHEALYKMSKILLEQLSLLYIK
ncbi:MAG: hydroxyacid dehydrogenase [Bacteroidetes bacterium]|nr:hydroxyacid dehydrogenase [Bacteroidota bacterium]